MDLTAINRAFKRVSRLGLDRVDRPTARYVQGSNQYLIIAVLSGVPFVIFLLIADAAHLWPAALVEGALIAIWLGCFALNSTGRAHLASVIELTAPLAAFAALSWLLSYRSGFLLPMLMTASVAFVTFPPRRLWWGLGLTVMSSLAVVWSFLAPIMAEPRLEVSSAMVGALLVANIAMMTVAMSLTSGLNHHYFTRERRRAERELVKADALARTDPLTKLTNRLGMTELLASMPMDKPYAMALIDLDRFKELNDRHGHPEGDVVLEAVARTLHDAIDAMGVVARWGGEEFVALMPEVSLVGAFEVIERARKATSALQPAGDGAHQVSFSAGLVAAPPGASWETTVRMADALLYEAKEAGRNCVRFTDMRSHA